VIVLAACGDNHPLPDAAARPDLVLVGAAMENTITIAPATFVDTDCEVLEQCVGAPGSRQLLRFDTVTANAGDADLVVGPPPAPGVSAGVFEWSPCHMHHHVKNYATYELSNASGLVVAGHKQSFCLHDVEAVRPEAPSAGYDCMNQGVSAGWADIYSRNLPCQWIDVTGVAPGTYVLRVEVNAAHDLVESNTMNNVWSREVVL
jgi:hypothetical protein